MIFQRNSIAMNISREMAIAYGLVEPTPEEVGEIRRRGERFAAEEAARTVKREAMLAALAAETDPVVVAIMAHHERDESYGHVRCLGCDQGCSCDSPDWPCSTIYALATARGIEMP